MRLLIDTHALLWYVDQDHLLTPAAHAAITDPANEILVSAATVWEIAIKLGIKKLVLSKAYRDWMNQAIADLGATVAPITIDSADVQSNLPLHHRDPFDRMLIAQATVEALTIISADAAFDAYGVHRLW